MSQQRQRGDLPEQAPTRLCDDPQSSPLVRRDLANVASASTHYDAAAGLLALHAALVATAKTAAASGAVASTAASIGSAAGKGVLALKLALAGGLAAAALGGTVLLRPPSRDIPPTTRHAPAVQHAPRVEHLPGPPSPPPAVVETPLPPQQRADAHAVHGPRDRAAAEIAQLAQINALIEAAPERALRLAEQGHHRFGEGYLHHEREGLAIIALCALERRDEARSRAARYLARYPNSPLTERVRELERALPKP